jgi:hypothetical protein
MELNFVNLKLVLTDKELEFIGSIDNSELNSEQLHNLSTYLNLLSRYPDAKNINLNNSDIIHACNYDSDEINDYWIILDRQFHFLDIGIPQVADLDDIKIYVNFSEHEKKIIKILKEYIV